RHCVADEALLAHRIAARRAALCQQPVVADPLRMAGDMLHPDQRGSIACLTQSMHDVLPVIMERKSAVGQADHTGRVRGLSRQQRSPARRAHRGSTERLPEENALLRQLLQAWRPHAVSIRLDVATCVVRVDIQDVWASHRTSPLLTSASAQKFGPGYCLTTIIFYPYSTISDFCKDVSKSLFFTPPTLHLSTSLPPTTAD